MFSPGNVQPATKPCGPTPWQVLAAFDRLSAQVHAQRRTMADQLSSLKADLSAESRHTEPSRPRSADANELREDSMRDSQLLRQAEAELTVRAKAHTALVAAHRIELERVRHETREEERRLSFALRRAEDELADARRLTEEQADKLVVLSQKEAESRRAAARAEEELAEEQAESESLRTKVGFFQRRCRELEGQLEDAEAARAMLAQGGAGQGYLTTSPGRDATVAAGRSSCSPGHAGEVGENTPRTRRDHAGEVGGAAAGDAHACGEVPADTRGPSLMTPRARPAELAAVAESAAVPSSSRGVPPEPPKARKAWVGARLLGGSKKGKERAPPATEAPNAGMGADEEEGVPASVEGPEGTAGTAEAAGGKRRGSKVLRVLSFGRAGKKK